LITAGNYITITGGSNAGTWLTQGVTVVSGVSVTVTISSTFVTQATGTAVSIVCHSGFVDETAPIDSSTISKYVSTEVQFTNTSTYLQVILAEAVPPAANVLVYYKTNPAGLTNGFGAIPYTLLQPQTPAPYTTNQTFTDVTYSVQNLPSFDAVQIKIVMQSTDTSQPPLLKDLRIIACA
jgi:hypothetical protein